MVSHIEATITTAVVEESDHRDLFKTATAYLYEGLEDIDRHALCILDRYILACNQNFESVKLHRTDIEEHTTDVLPCSVTELLAWTTLYNKQDKLNDACRHFVNHSVPLQNINWFRVLCCYLDRQRLKKAPLLLKKYKKNHCMYDRHDVLNELFEDTDIETIPCKDSLRKKRKRPNSYVSSLTEQDIYLNDIPITTGSPPVSPHREELHDECDSTCSDVIPNGTLIPVTSAVNTTTHPRINQNNLIELNDPNDLFYPIDSMSDTDPCGPNEKKNDYVYQMTNSEISSPNHATSSSTDLNILKLMQPNDSLESVYITNHKHKQFESQMLLLHPTQRIMNIVTVNSIEYIPQTPNILFSNELLLHFIEHWSLTAGTLLCEQFSNEFNKESRVSHIILQDTHDIVSPVGMSNIHLVSLYQKLYQLLLWVMNMYDLQDSNNLTTVTTTDIQSIEHNPYPIYIFSSLHCTHYLNQLIDLIFALLINPTTHMYTKDYSSNKENQQSTMTSNVDIQLQPNEMTPLIKFKLVQDFIVPIQDSTYIQPQSLHHRLGYTLGGQWTNPKFAYNLLQFKHTSLFELYSLISSSYLTHWSLTSFNNDLKDKWEYTPNTDNQEIFSHLGQQCHQFIFLSGVLTLIHDILCELWIRISTVSSRLIDSSPSDILKEMKVLSTLVLKRHSLCANELEIDVLFNEFEALLNCHYLPNDLKQHAAAALTLVKEAKYDWYQIQKENDAKKKEAEEAETLKRHVAQQEAVRREQQRRLAVQYIMNAVSKEKQTNIKNPFSLLGMSPIMASIPLLMKIKRKLSLLLHPDKCQDSDFKNVAQAAFTAVIEAVSNATKLVENGTHLSYTPPAIRPPFAEEVGLPQQSSSSSIPKFTQFIGKNPFPQSNMTNPSRTTTPNPTPDPTAPSPTTDNIINIWKSGDFNEFFEANICNVSSQTTRCLPTPKFSTRHSTKSHIWVTVPESNSCYIRFFVSRPHSQPSPKDSFSEAHDAEDGITFLVPGILCSSLKKGIFGTSLPDLQLPSNRNYAAKTLSRFSAVFMVKCSTFNLSEWLITNRDVVQPIDEIRRRKCGIYVAAQMVDATSNTVSEVAWTSVSPRRFVLPLKKPKIINAIKLFENAPDSYRILDIVNANSGATELYNEFPPVRTLSGWTNAMLTTLLTALIESAGKLDIVVDSR